MRIIVAYYIKDRDRLRRLINVNNIHQRTHQNATT